MICLMMKLIGHAHIGKYCSFQEVELPSLFKTHLFAEITRVTAFLVTPVIGYSKESLYRTFERKYAFPFMICEYNCRILYKYCIILIWSAGPCPVCPWGIHAGATDISTKGGGIGRKRFWKCEDQVRLVVYGQLDPISSQQAHLMLLGVISTNKISNIEIKFVFYKEQSLFIHHTSHILPNTSIISQQKVLFCNIQHRLTKIAGTFL